MKLIDQIIVIKLNQTIKPANFTCFENGWYQSNNKASSHSPDIEKAKQQLQKNITVQQTITTPVCRVASNFLPPERPQRPISILRELCKKL